MFTESSIVVKTWVKAVRNGTKKAEEVPNISNLREVVLSIIEGGE
mgnify:CR=1